MQRILLFWWINEFIVILWTMNLNREILRLTLPAIATNVTIPLLGLADTAIAGHLGSSEAMASVSIGALMFNVVFWLFGFIRMGTTGLTAQAYGGGSSHKTKEVLVRALTLSALIGIGLILFSPWLQRLLSFVISAEPAVAQRASLYFSICIWASPALLGIMTVSGWLLGMQNTVIPMWISIIVNLLNICVSLVLVVGFGIGYQGIAIGTLAANWIGIAIAILWTRKFASITGKLLSLRTLLQGSGLRRFFTVNTDIFFRSACIMAVSLACGAFGARIGAVTVAANAVLLQFFSFFSYFMDGIAFTAEAMSGRFAGAGDKLMFHRSVKYLLGWSAATASIFFLIYYFGFDIIIRLVTDNAEVIEKCGEYRIFILLLPPATVGAFIFDGFFIGLTATRRMLVVTACAAALFFAVCLFSKGSFSFPDNSTIWTAFLLYLLLRGVLLALLSPSVFSLRQKLPSI